MQHGRRVVEGQTHQIDHMLGRLVMMIVMLMAMMLNMTMMVMMTVTIVVIMTVTIRVMMTRTNTIQNDGDFAK